jgi:Zn-finger nucleic acid-binding protein
MNCIDCGAPMKTNRCACGGAWLSEAKIVEMAQDMKGTMVALPWVARKGDPRACPVCAKGMLTVSLVKVALDRCADHGVWFDADELQTVLESASKLPDAILDGPNVKLGHSNSAAPDYSYHSGSSSVGGWWILGAIFDVIDIATD